MNKKKIIQQSTAAQMADNEGFIPCDENPFDELALEDDVQASSKRLTIKTISDQLLKIKENPKHTYSLLEKKIFKQTEAKKAASLIVWNHVNGRPSVSIFTGPSGCGKTEIWRVLRKYVNIRIVDVSEVSLDGWKGSLKWETIFGRDARNGFSSIIVLDEVDKMITPKITTGGRNAATDVQSACLTYLAPPHTYSVVLCGAFSEIRSEKKQVCQHSIGFSSISQDDTPDADISIDDMIEYGMIPEFAGRIDRIVNLEPLTMDDYYAMLCNGIGPLRDLQEQYQIDIQLSESTKHEIAQQAYDSGLGVRNLRTQLIQMLDRRMFDQHDSPEYIF